MANEKRKQFTFYVSFYETVIQFTRSADREKFLMAIIEYALFEKEPEKLQEGCRAAFMSIKPILDKARKRAEAGRAGGSSSASKQQANDKQTEASDNQPQANRKLERDRERERDRDRVREEGETASILLEKLWQEYPAHRRGSLQNLTDTAAMLSLGNDDVVKATENLATWKNSRDWSKDDGQYVPGLTRYLTSGMWADKPKKTELPKGASGELGEAELEAIRRVLAEPMEPAEDQEGGG